MTDTYSESYRAECEARQVAEWGRTNPARARRHLELVAAKRGEEAAQQLRQDSLKVFQQQRSAA